jgi:hypothetical protein
MGRVLYQVAAPEGAEALEWVDLAREEWVVPGQVWALEENACVQNAERLLLMKLEHRAPL